MVCIVLVVNTVCPTKYTVVVLDRLSRITGVGMQAPAPVLKVVLMLVRSGADGIVADVVLIAAITWVVTVVVFGLKQISPETS
jgi:hypothetical protein